MTKVRNGPIANEHEGRVAALPQPGKLALDVVGGDIDELSK